MKKPDRRMPRGFTLIELMIVVAIIGIVASIAIPEFRTMAFRAKMAERDPIMRGIAKGVGDLMVNSTGPIGDTTSESNPVLVPGSVAHPWRRGAAGFRDLSFVVEGSTYCAYSYDFVQATEILVVRGQCDIDGDSEPNLLVQVYEGYGNGLVLLDPGVVNSNVF